MWAGMMCPGGVSLGVSLASGVECCTVHQGGGGAVGVLGAVILVSFSLYAAKQGLD